MTEKEIEDKRQLVLSNKLKRARQVWRPAQFEPEHKKLLERLTQSFCASNVLPDGKVIRVSSFQFVRTFDIRLLFSVFCELLLYFYGLVQAFVLHCPGLHEIALAFVDLPRLP